MDGKEILSCQGSRPQKMLPARKPGMASGLAREEKMEE